MSKFKNLIGILVLMTFLVSCGGNNENMEEVTNADSSEGMKIAIISSPSGVDDGSFNENNYDGILMYVNENPDATVSPIQEPTGSPDAAIEELNNIVGDYDAFVLAGFQFAAASQTALDNPDKNFILVDSEPTPIDEQTVFDNLVSLTFKEHESAFLAGIAAASESKTGKVAVVNGIAYPSNVNYQFGFTAGVNYSNKNFGTTVEVVELPAYGGTDVTGAQVGGNYVGSFNDEATGKIVGQKLLEAGVDICLVAAGNSGNGIFTAFKESEEDVFVIGCDVDQYDDGVAGDKNIILTSALKKMDINVKRQLDAIKNETFEGSNLLLDATTDSIGIVLEDGRQQLSSDTITKVNDLFELIKDGTIVPPSNFSGTTAEEFTGL
ncbi:MAG: BMP family protein [Lachnospirales bacterium]